MLYREVGQFKTSYAADQAIFPILQDRIGLIVILLIAVGSVLAMALPILVALAGIAVGLAIIGLLTHAYPLQTFSTTLATMIGIGVGIDYALFVVTRYRQGLHADPDVVPCVAQSRARPSLTAALLPR